MKKRFEQPELQVERFQVTDCVTLSGWMQFEDEGRTFDHFNGFVIEKGNDTRLG